MLEKWKKITNKDIPLIKNKNKELKTIEYFNSIIYLMYNLIPIRTYMLFCVFLLNLK